MIKISDYIFKITNLIFYNYKLKKIFSYFSIPAIIFHELSHIIMGLFSGYFYSYIDSYFITNESGLYTIGLSPNKYRINLFQILTISLSPLFVLIGVLILSILYPIFFILFVYLIITLFYSFPSRGDIIKIKYAKLFRKYEHDDEVVTRFLIRKGEIEKEDNLEWDPSWSI